MAKVNPVDLQKVADSAVKKDAQSAQEETSLHKKAPLFQRGFVFENRSQLRTY